MPAKIALTSIIQMTDDMKTLRKIYQRFAKLATDEEEDHFAVREFERVYRNLDRILDAFKQSDLTIKG